MRLYLTREIYIVQRTGLPKKKIQSSLVRQYASSRKVLAISPFTSEKSNLQKKKSENRK